MTSEGDLIPLRLVGAFKLHSKSNYVMAEQGNRPAVKRIRLIRKPDSRFQIQKTPYSSALRHQL